MKYIYDDGYIAYTYKPKRQEELPPEYKEKLRRMRERRDAELRRRFPRYFKG